MSKFFSIIPARANSKRIANKNTVLIQDKPLILYTIETSLKTSSIHKTIITTDDKNVLELVIGKNIETIQRPSDLAQDDTTMIPVIKHVLDYNSELQVYDYFVLLQPTSPLRTSAHIQEAIDLVLEKNTDSLISVVEVERNPLKAFKINENGVLHGIVNNHYPFASNQFLPKCYYPNGAIYIKRVSTFLEDNSLIDETTIPYIMNPEDSIDIDTYADLEVVDRILKGRK